MSINLNDKTNKSIADLATKIMESEPAKVRDFSDIKPIQSDMVQRVMNTGMKQNFIKENVKQLDETDYTHRVWFRPKDGKGSHFGVPAHSADSSTAHKKLHDYVGEKLAKNYEPYKVEPYKTNEEVEQIDERKRGNARHSDEAAQNRLRPRASDVTNAKGTTNRQIAATNLYARKIAKITTEYKPKDVVSHLKSLEESKQLIVDRLKAEGEHEKAGAAAFKHGLGRGYGVHVGMRHTRDKDEADFHRGYDTAERIAKNANMKEEAEQIDEKNSMFTSKVVKMHVKTEKGGQPFQGTHTVIVNKVPTLKTPKIEAATRQRAEASLKRHLKSKGHTVTDIEHLGEGYNAARTQGTAYGRRDISGNRAFKSAELQGELGHEENIPHAVYIDGKHWKTFPTHSHATNVRNSLVAKGKKAVVYVAEDHMSDEQKAKREEIAMGMKPVSKWEKRYPGRGEEVMYATATKMAMKEEQLGEEEMNRIIGEAKDFSGITKNWHKMSSRAKDALMARHGDALKNALGHEAIKSTGGQAKQSQAPKKPETSTTVTALANKFSGSKPAGPAPKSKSLADIRAENMRRTKEAQEKGIAHGNAQSRPGGNAGENPDARDKESDLMKSSHEIAGEKAAAKGGTAGAIVKGSLKPDRTAKERKPGEDEEEKKLEEAKLKGNQNVLDVAAPKGKLTAADFKRLRAMRKGK